MFAGIDPSRLDPKVLQELSQLMQSLAPDQLMKMQSIMHNSMAGFDVTRDVQAFENSLPSEFRARLAKLALASGAMGAPETSHAAGSAIDVAPSSGAPVESVDEARLTLLRAVRDGKLSPEEARSALFPT